MPSSRAPKRPAAKKAAQPGLYANIHAKQERIAHGSGETMREPPSEEAFEKAAGAKKATAKSTAAKKASAKKAPARKPAAKKSSARRASAKKSSTKRT